MKYDNPKYFEFWKTELNFDLTTTIFEKYLQTTGLTLLVIFSSSKNFLFFNYLAAFIIQVFLACLLVRTCWLKSWRVWDMTQIPLFVRIESISLIQLSLFYAWDVVIAENIRQYFLSFVPRERSVSYNKLETKVNTLLPGSILSKKKNVSFGCGETKRFCKNQNYNL